MCRPEVEDRDSAHSALKAKLEGSPHFPFFQHQFANGCPTSITSFRINEECPSDKALILIEH